MSINRTLLFSAVAVIVVLLSCGTPARANPSLVVFLIDYLAGKAIDPLWDRLTGKPDVAQLQKRVTDLETVVGEAFHAPLEAIRNQIRPDITKDEFRGIVLDFSTRFEQIEQKIAKNSDAIERLNERMSSLEGTQHELAEKLKSRLQAQESTDVGKTGKSLLAEPDDDDKDAKYLSGSQPSKGVFPDMSARYAEVDRSQPPRYSGAPRSAAVGKQPNALTCWRCRNRFLEIPAPLGHWGSYRCPRCHAINRAFTYRVTTFKTLRER